MDYWIYQSRLKFMYNLMPYARTIPIIPSDDQLENILEKTPRLNDRDKFVVRSVWTGQHYDVICKKMDPPVTRERARQIFMKSIRRMRGRGNEGLLNIGLTHEQLEQYNREWADYFGFEQC